MKKKTFEEVLNELRAIRAEIARLEVELILEEGIGEIVKDIDKRARWRAVPRPV
jgi:hypothetical protein